MINKRIPTDFFSYLNCLDKTKTPNFPVIRKFMSDITTRNGDEARLKTTLGPNCENTDRSISSNDLVPGNLATKESLSANFPNAHIYDEESEESAVRPKFTPLIYLACLAAAIKYRARLTSIVIVARNHDATLFSTNSGGTLHNQAIYYPAESDQIFGACNCLRYRNNYKPCEHLAFIALTELFSSSLESAMLPARLRPG